MYTFKPIVFMKPSHLSTKRITLRRSQNSDVEILFHNYFSASCCSKFLTRQPHLHVNQTQNFLNSWCDNAWDYDLGKFGWVIASAESDEPIGVFLVMLEEHKAQIHFGISKNFWRQGLVTEAGNAVIQWLMNQPDLQRIWAVCDLLNQGSSKVLEKLNFQKEGILHNWVILPAFGGSARDCYMYALTYERYWS